MYVSKETSEQTSDRLRKVILEAEMQIFPAPYYFKEMAVSEPFHFDPEALAIVRDKEVWSHLIPAVSNKSENFKVFSFHFKEGLDNSGFVGWLASIIKEQTGSGVMVICGQNSNKGGIFDYWGCPIEVSDKIIEVVLALKGET